MSMEQPPQRPVKATYWLAAESSTFPASRINNSLINHLFCGFATINRTTYEVEFPPPTEPFITFSQIVKPGSNVRTMLSIGGKNFPPEIFVNIVSKEEYLKNFIDSLIKLARLHGFDGLDLCWIYPRTPAEMEILAALLYALRKAINADTRSPRLLLTMPVYRSPNIGSSTYPTLAMKENLDWANVIAYDFTDPSRSRDATAAPAPLYNPAGGPCVDDGIKEWLTPLRANQVVLGLPFYGYAWKLVDPNQHGIGAPAQGQYVGDNGFKTYKEIKKLLEQGFKHVNEPRTDYCYKQDMWVAYDGPETIQKKVSYAKNEKELLGYFGFNVGRDSDDWELARIASEAWGE